MNFSWYCFRYFLAYSKFSKLNSPLVPEKSEGKQKLIKKLEIISISTVFLVLQSILCSPASPKYNISKYNTKALLRTPEKLFIKLTESKKKLTKYNKFDLGHSSTKHVFRLTRDNTLILKADLHYLKRFICKLKSAFVASFHLAKTT